MPAKMRKLILIYKIRFINPVQINCAPFHLFNLEQLGEVSVPVSALVGS